MLSKLMVKASRSRFNNAQRMIFNSRRNFSSEVATVDKTLGNEADKKTRLVNRSNIFDHKDLEAHIKAKEEAATDKAYYEMLGDMDARQRFFKAFTAPDSEDHSEISKVKNKINKLIEQE